MRILTVVGNLDLRGTQRAAQNFSTAYKTLGHTVAVLAHESGGPRQAFLEAQDIPVWVGGSQLPKALAQSRDFSPDIIHIHRVGVSNAIEGEILRALRAGSSARVIETNVFGRVDWSEDSRQIDVHCPVSRWCLYRWRRWSRLSSSGPAVYLPNLIDTDTFSPVSDQARGAFRERHAIAPDAFVCGRAGKWHPVVFKAFGELLRVHRNSILVSVDDFPPELGQHISQLPRDIQQHIRVIPQMCDDQQLAEFYSSLDCFVQSNHVGETFGLVLVESLSCGTPVVTASRPHKDNGQVEVVGHLRGGVVAGCQRRLPKALIALAQNPALLAKCRTTCRASVVSRYALQTVAASAIRLAEAALASGSPTELARKLDDNEEYTTQVDDAEICHLLDNTWGGPCPSELALMKLVMNPVVYRAYYEAKTRLAQWRGRD
jgi:glycosyltransferase involved in cell wall biosynthesis